MSHNHRNRNWQRRWSYEPAVCVSTHETGLQVSYRLDDGSRPEIGGLCWDDNARQWLCEAVTIPPDLPDNQLPRLMREAGEIFVKKFLKDKH